jgi:hypothetical protein
MQTENLALYVKSRLPWVLTAALLLGASAPATAGAASQAHQHRHAIPASWGSYQPQGWSAGAVARGTGYWRPGASLRVREVQRRLNRLGYGAGKADGFFGPITDTAVRRYQGDRALRLDGIVGPQTLRNLRSQSDLRSRTRRVQRSADRQTSGREPQTRTNTGSEAAHRQDAAAQSATQTKARRGASRPAEADRDGSDRLALWQVVPLVAAFLAILLLAVVLARFRHRRPRAADGLPRTVYVEGQSADERVGAFRGFAYTIRPMTDGEEQAGDPAHLLVYDASKPKPVYARLSEITAIDGQAIRPSPVPETGRSASVTPLSSRRRTPPARRLRIVRRIEAPRPVKGGGARRASGNHHASGLHGSRFPNRFRWLGARVHLADAEGVDHMPGTLPVELELFAESESRRWETGLLEADEPLRVSASDLESSVRAAVVPEWIPALAQALAEGGVVTQADELARLPFAVERSIEVERALGMEAFSKQAS